MSTNWDNDVKKYRAKRMSVSGHQMQPAFAPKLQANLLSIHDTFDEELSDDDSDDDQPSRYGNSPTMSPIGSSTSSSSHMLTPTTPPPHQIKPMPQNDSKQHGYSHSNDHYLVPQGPLDINSNDNLSSNSSGYYYTVDDDELEPPPIDDDDDPSESILLSPSGTDIPLPPEDTDSFWIELEGKWDKDFTLFINTKTQQTTHIKPPGYTPPTKRSILRGGGGGGGIDLNTDPSGGNDGERLTNSLHQITRYIDQYLVPISKLSGEHIQDELIRIKTLMEKLHNTLATQHVANMNKGVVNFLIGYEKFQWDFQHPTSQTKMDYYYASSSLKTNHQLLEYKNWHIPEYFSQSPLVPNVFKKTITVHLAQSDAEKLPPHRPRRKIIESKFDDTVDSLLANAVGVLYDRQTSPQNFCFRVVGHSEFLTSGKPLWSYSHLRKCIRDNNDVELVLMKVPSPIEYTQQQTEQLELIQNDYSSRIKSDVVSEVIEPNTYADLTDPTYLPYNQLSNLKYIPANTINVPFSVNIIGLDNVTNETLPRLNNDIVSVYIRVTLLHGIVELPFQFDTQNQDISGDTVLVNETLYGGPQSILSTIPRESRIAYMLYGRYKEDSGVKDIELGAVVNQIYNERGVLLGGQNAHYVWGFPASSDGKKVGSKRDKDPLYLFRCQNYDNHTKGVPKCIVRVKYPTYPLPVVSPLVSRYYEANLRIVGSELKKPLDKGASHNLIKLINADPLFELTPEHKQLLWNSRHFLIDVPAVLPKLLSCVDWMRADYRNEAYRLLKIWALPMNPVEAIGLLDAKFADYRVREYAVNILKALDDEDLQLYSLQLVQCIKYEPYHDSPLSRFLIERAIRSPYQIGHTFFWHLKAEVHDPTICERFTVILEELLANIGIFVEELYKQVTAVTQLQQIAEHVWRMKREFNYSDEETTIHYHQKLHELNEKIFIPQGKFQIPLHPVVEGTTLIVEKCRFMSSKMVPLWLVFKNADPVAPPIYLIFKSGDDLRQDLLTLQILRIMDRLWLQQGLDMRLKPYNVIATGVNEVGEGVGMIEVVLNSTTTSDIQVKYGGGARGALKLDPIDLYLRQHNNDPTSYGTAVSNFIQSCAGYCVATYVLGIGDRHNGNIMVTKSGHLFHIDFGHFLGNFKKKFGMNRERAAFVFTPEMAFVMGGKEYKRSEKFRQFKQNCTKSFRVLRQNAALLEALFTLLIAAGMPELNEMSHILYLRVKLDLDVDPKTASKGLQNELKKALESTSRRLDNMIHNWKHA